MAYKQGDALPFSKLNAKLVRIIRAEHAAKEKMKRELDTKHSAAAMAKRYQVHKATIEKVLSYETWRHVL